MIARFLRWLWAWFGYRAGRSAQRDADHLQAVETDNEIARTIVEATDAAPASRGDLVQRLRERGL